MTNNQLLALKTGCKVRVVKPDNYWNGWVTTFNGLKTYGCGNAKLVLARLRQDFKTDICFIASDIEVWKEPNVS